VWLPIYHGYDPTRFKNPNFLRMMMIEYELYYFADQRLFLCISIYFFICIG
jgi:hypothetical protein